MIEKLITLGPIKQLIDVNDSLKNFIADFTIECDNEFDVVVVTQTMLDDEDSIEYKHITTGTMSGRIVQDKNNFEHFFILIKSDNPSKAKIYINIEELNIPKDVPKDTHVPKEPRLKNVKKNDDKRLYMLGLGIVIVASLFFYVVYRNTSVTSVASSASATSDNVNVNDIIDIIPAKSFKDINIIDRINSLDL